MKIQISKPAIGDEEIREVEKVLRSGMLVQGERVEEFEKAIKDYIGMKHGIATSNGTTALQIAFELLGLRPGDEVITSPFTFISCANTILMSGAKPVFADIDEKTFNIDPEKIREKITEKTKAVLPVHIFGQPCNLGEITKICRENNLILIEDCAQSLGAEYRGKKAGSFGELSTFSFYATKNIATGEGGMILTNDSGMAEKARLLRSHGQVETYRHKIIGYNFRMTEMAAAIGLVQMRKLEKLNKKRTENARFLSERLSGKKDIEVPYVANDVKHIFHQYVIRVLNGKRDSLMEKLLKADIEVKIFYPTLYVNEPYLQLGYKKGLCPVSESLSEQVLALPVHPLLSDEEMEKIAGTVIENI